MTMTAPRKARRATKFARGSAAAFALGVFLAGPQAAVAGADTGDDAGPAAGKGSAIRGADRPAPDRELAARGGGPARTAVAGSTRVPAPAAARSARPAAAIVPRMPAVRPAESDTASAVVAPESLASAPPAARDVDLAAHSVTPAPYVESAPYVDAEVDAVPIALAAMQPVTVAAQAAPVTALTMAQGAVDGFFHSLSDFLAGLPDSDFTTTLEGALLLVRRTLFNQAPIATPVQTAVTEAGQILGAIAGRDPDGDAVTYTVVDGPQYGTVEVGEDGTYLYTPGEGYAGSDGFTVRIDGDASGFNILNPGGHATTDVQVLVGAGAATNPFTAGTHQDPVDATLHLANTAAQITVDNTQGRFTATVSLIGVTPDTQLMWMDGTGRRGQVSVAEMVGTHWEEYASAAEANGGGVTLGVVYAAENGSEHAVVLTDVHATQNADGQIVFTGDLAPDAAENPGLADDFWDIIGIGFKSDYENFRREYVEVSDFAPVSVTVTEADVYTDTYSLSDFKKELATTDGLRLPDTSGSPQSSAVETAAPDGRILQLTQSVTATLPNAKGVIVGLADGSVRQWDGTGWAQLRAAGGVVKALLALPQGTAVVVEQDGLLTVSQLSGTTWTQIYSFKWDAENQKLSGLTAIPTAAGFILAKVAESKCWLGSTCDADKANPYTYVSVYQNGTSSPAPAISGRVTSAIAYQNGVVAALDDGTVQRWDGTSWSTLLDDSGYLSNTITTAIAAYKDGIAITQDDGSVRVWTPAGGWVDNIGGYRKVEAYNTVTALSVFGDQILVGYDNGDFLQFNPNAVYSDEYPGRYYYPIPDAKTADQLGLGQRYDGYAVGAVSSIQSYGTGAVVTWAKGVVAQWDFGTNTWSSMRLSTDGETVGSIVKDGGNLILTVNTDDTYGHVSTWKPADKQFLELGGASELALTSDTLKAAMEFVRGGGTAMSAGDPIFNLAANRAACEGLGTCTGSYQMFQFFTDPKVPYGVPLKSYLFGAKEATTANPPSLGLRYDVGVTSYGYLFIPDGKWEQLDPQYYSLGFMLAKTTGPSLNLNLPLNDEADGQYSLDVATTALDEVSVEVPTPYGVFGIEGNVNVGIRATLELPKGFNDLQWYQQKLTVSYYDTQGSLYTYNTAGREGFAKTDKALPAEFAYPDGEVIKNLTLGPTINPTVNLAWGLYKNFPVIGELSFLKVALGYENPVTLNLGLDKDGNPTVTGSVSGNFTAEAGVLGSFVNFLTWKYSKPIYKDTVNLLNPSAPATI